jgi:4-amino-4-deoxy-L-arabinose transferase-like glycosyltransferase
MRDANVIAMLPTITSVTRPHEAASDADTPLSGAHRTSLWLILVVALVARLIWATTVPDVLENEGSDFIRLAESLAQGRYDGVLGGPTISAPLYPTLILILSWPIGSAEWAARMISVIAGTLLVLSVAGLVRQLAGPRPALLAAALTAAHPALIALSAAVLSESLYFCLIFAVGWMACQLCERPTYRGAAVVGVLLGLSYLTRPEATLVAIFTLSITFVWWLGRLRWRRAIAYLATATLIFVALASPYVVYLSSHSGKLRLEAKTAFITMVNARMANGADYNQASYSLKPRSPQDWPMVSSVFELSQPNTLDMLRQQLRGLGYRTRKAVISVLENRAAATPFLLLATAIGLLSIRWLQAASLLVGAIGACCFVSMVSVWFLFPRYVWVAAPFIAIFGAIGIAVMAQMAARWTARWPRVPTYLVVATVAIAVSTGPGTAAVLSTYDVADSRKPFVRDVGEWLSLQARHPGRRLRIMGIGTPTAVYAGGVLVYLPYTDEKTALAYINEQAPDFVVIRPDERRERPYLADWVRHGIPSSCARPVKRIPTVEASGDVVVYEWKCTEEFSKSVTRDDEEPTR